MGYIPLDGMPHPELSREKLAVRVAEQALQINERLLAERKPARTRTRKARAA